MGPLQRLPRPTGAISDCRAQTTSAVSRTVTPRGSVVLRSNTPRLDGAGPVGSVGPQAWSTAPSLSARKDFAGKVDQTRVFVAHHHQRSANRRRIRSGLLCNSGRLSAAGLLWRMQTFFPGHSFSARCLRQPTFMAGVDGTSATSFAWGTRIWAALCPTFCLLSHDLPRRLRHCKIHRSSRTQYS